MMHPSMQRYAGNPMMRFHSEDNGDEGYGPVQPHSYPGHAQHEPIFVVPEAVRARRPSVSQPICLGQESGAPAAFLRNDLDGFSDVFQRLAHGFPKKRPRPEPCNHEACRLKQHIPEFGLPYTALSPRSDDEQAWLQAKRAAERKRAAALEQEIEKDKAASVQSGAESFRNAWSSGSVELAVQGAQDAVLEEAEAAESFAQEYLKRLQDCIAAPDDEKEAMTQQMIEDFATSTAERHERRLQEARNQQKATAYQTALEWAKEVRDAEEEKHEQRAAATHAAAEAAAKQFAEEWKQRRRNEEAARRAQVQESWRKRQEQQIAALRALREQQEEEKARRRKQLEEAAEQLLAEQRKELERAEEASALKQKQEEEAARLRAAHQQELEQQQREHDAHIEQTLTDERARQAAETERVASLWRQAREQREAEMKQLAEHLQSDNSPPASCTCELPHQPGHTTPSQTDTSPAETPEPPAEPTPEDKQKQSLAKIAAIRKTANKAAAEWRDGAFVPIHEDKSNEKEVMHARHVFEEALLQEVLHLDLIESEGDLEVRRARKQAIKDIEDCVSTLKEYSSFYDYKPDFKTKSVLMAENQA